MKHIIYLIIFTFSGILQAQQWQDSFDDALTKAAGEDKPIVLVFSGSDWCAPCIRLKRHVFDSDEFKTYAAAHYVMYDADFPRKKKNQLSQEKLNINKSLAEKYNPRGYFPLVVVMDKNQNVLGTTGFVARTSPEKYIKTLNKFLK
ncbi:thioredoxin family protein [Flagellimonas lutimaris]|jgi:thioredoxin-related protein|uniref:thioredoxin family protein n=1 Tax=Flagellimonas TaxID=444459 RepID=UPI000B66612E|nr:MAG: thioredoxin family protein [Muricauda sp. TMED12]|tara:strand:- start:38849 stop:39286 length:438 start_codon:yes stop_codon:yes gene_type:complete